MNRALIRDWSRSVWAMSSNPIRELIACFDTSKTPATLRFGTPRRLGELVATGLVGCLHQRGAELIADGAMRRRLRDLVDVAFASVDLPWGSTIPEVPAQKFEIRNIDMSWLTRYGRG